MVDVTEVNTHTQTQALPWSLFAALALPGAVPYSQHKLQEEERRDRD